MRHILSLRENLVVGTFDKKLIEGDRHTNEHVFVLLLNRDKLYLSVILSDLIGGKKIHEVETEDSVHLLRIRDQLAELLIVVSSQYAHMLLVLLNVLLLDAEERGVLVDLSCKNTLLSLRLEAWWNVFEESKLALELLDDLVSFD